MRMEKLIENMIRFAESKLGSTEYAGWCLVFIEDALEISNHIEIYGQGLPLVSGYLHDVTGVYQTPHGYYVKDEDVDEFDKEFPPKEKLKLPGQIFE